MARGGGGQPELKIERLIAVADAEGPAQGITGRRGFRPNGSGLHRLGTDLVKRHHEALLALELIPPVPRHIQQCIQVKANALRRQRLKQIEAADSRLAVQQSVQRAEHRAAVSVVIDTHQIGNTVQEAAARPAVEHLTRHAPVGDQGRVEQLENPGPTGGIEQIKPDPQLGVGAPTGTAPVRQILDGHWDHNAIQLHLEGVGCPQRTRRHHRHHQTDGHPHLRPQPRGSSC